MELSLGLGLLVGAWLRGRGCSGPDEDRALLIYSQSLCRDEFKLQVLKCLIIQRELALEQAVRHAPTPLQHRHGLVYHLCKRHGGPSPSPATPCPLSVRFSCVSMLYLAVPRIRSVSRPWCIILPNEVLWYPTIDPTAKVR